jgi:CubicO group peptidase (beta-lactamase class C family)
LPNTTPAYSNAAFATLGLVVEAVANSTFDVALRDLLVAPLGLNGTTISAPEDLTKAVIPGNASISGWDIDLSDTTGAAMGGFFSTPNDLSAIGRAILSSSLLPSSTTRAWLKPTSFTSSLLGAVGHAWEIYRAVTNAQHNRVIDLYTKAGNLPGYGANLILIPDFDVGIVVMMAGERGTIGQAIAGVIIDELLPALDEAARVQADNTFTGTYTASNGLNSTVKLTTAPGIPGLSIEEWISNGTDLRSALLGLRSASFGDPGWFQMYPTNIVSRDGKQISWRSTTLSLPDTGSPFDACPSWVSIDRPNYGIYGVDDFVFHLGEDGKAWGLEPKALKIVLKKV